MTAPRKQIAIFPDLPREPFIGKVDADGNVRINELWQQYFDNLTRALQTNYKPEGLVIPPQIASNIALLTATASNNNIIYDSTNNLFKGNIAGTWKVFTLT